MFHVVGPQNARFRTLILLLVITFLMNFFRPNVFSHCILSSFNKQRVVISDFLIVLIVIPACVYCPPGILGSTNDKGKTRLLNVTLFITVLKQCSTFHVT